MLRSAILVRLATRLGLIEPGAGPGLIGAFRAAGAPELFEDWAAKKIPLDGGQHTTLRDAWTGMTLRCKGCGSEFPGSEMLQENLACGVCGTEDFDTRSDSDSGTRSDISSEQTVPRPDRVERHIGGGNPGASMSAPPPPPRIGGGGPPGLPGRSLIADDRLTTNSYVPPPNRDEILLEARPSDNRLAAVSQGGPVSDLKRPLVAGDVIGNAEILGRAGEGGMGTVYRARHRGLGRPVAVKVITPDRLANAEALTRFRREAQTMAAFDHTHIVQVYDYGEIGGGAYLTMQWVDGESVADMIKRERRLPMHRALEIYIATAKALAAAHKHEVIHRDLKPDNILISKDGGIKLADFGLAKTAVTEDHNLTRPDVVLGTPLYMAPEQVEGTVGPQADLYALGCSLYHTLTGQPPFRAKGLWNLLRKHADEPFPSVQDLLPEAPASLDKLLKRMCAKRPQQRPQTADEVAEGLEKILNEADTGGGGPEVPLPLARALRDFHARSSSPQAVYAACKLFETLVQTISVAAAAPFLVGGRVPVAVSKSMASLAKPQRYTGWVMAMRTLLKYHEEMKTPGDMIAQLQLFTRTRREGDALRSLVTRMQQLAARIPALAQRIQKLEVPIGFAGWALPIAMVLDAAEAAGARSPLNRDFALDLGGAVEEILAERPPLPQMDFVWFELTDDLPDGRIRAVMQSLHGEHPRQTTSLELASNSPEMMALGDQRDQGLFLRSQGQLLPLEPLVAFDDGEWYALNGIDNENAEYRCSSSGHRLLLPRDSVVPTLFSIFPQGLKPSPIVAVTATGNDLKADLRNFPGDLAGLLGQASRLARSNPQQSMDFSIQAAAHALGMVLNNPNVQLVTAVELLRNASPPLVPTMVESMAGLAQRAPMLGTEGAVLALFASVRMACWVSGSSSVMLNYNPQQCLEILGEEAPSAVEGFQPTLKRGNRVAGKGGSMALSTPGGDAGDQL
ncbi:MAG: serine/threonine-protein kinase, partial [Planctomycetota bacterium]